MTPVVGVTAWSTIVRDVPVDLPHQAVAENYLEALQSAGLTSVLIPVSSDPGGAADMLDRIDGLVLTGGGDIVPSAYGAAQEPQTANVDTPPGCRQQPRRPCPHRRRVRRQIPALPPDQYQSTAEPAPSAALPWFTAVIW